MVITDLQMPRLDGYGLAAAIRRHEAEVGGPRTPIMALSANVMQGEPQRCRAAGMDDFAGKPTSMALLAAKLREWLPHLEWSATPADEGGDGDPDGAGAGSVLDPAVLADLTGGDAALGEAILQDFLESTTVDLDRLGEAVEGHDLDEVRRQAHRIKGASGTVGMKLLAQLAARIETGSQDEGADLEALRALRADAVAALALVAGELGRRPTQDAHR